VIASIVGLQLRLEFELPSFVLWRIELNENPRFDFVRAHFYVKLTIISSLA